ncbi:hypothetical protein ILYODFUR_018205 [Ilyodon furcidens]|uniref:Uncharacterized protein n=1 Tax=Ilyodon furcidens TaxID=33524 RepID=A0ABV0SNG6_9TELE
MSIKTFIAAVDIASPKSKTKHSSLINKKNDPKSASTDLSEELWWHNMSIKPVSGMRNQTIKTSDSTSERNPIQNTLVPLNSFCRGKDHRRTVRQTILDQNP